MCWCFPEAASWRERRRSESCAAIEDWTMQQRLGKGKRRSEESKSHVRHVHYTSSHKSEGRKGLLQDPPFVCNSSRLCAGAFVGLS